MKILFIIGFILLFILGFINRFFMPKWLYWITPKAYSAYDVLSEQYGGRTALWFIAIVVVVGAGIFFVLEYGSHHGW
jgi:hypothetical protein